MANTLVKYIIFDDSNNQKEYIVGVRKIEDLSYMRKPDGSIDAVRLLKGRWLSVGKGKYLYTEHGRFVDNDMQMQEKCDIRRELAAIAQQKYNTSNRPATAGKFM